MRTCVVALTALLAAGGTAIAESRQVISFNADWRFALAPSGSGFAEARFDDSTWILLSLPHTWNAFDGQDGGDYVRDDGWYRKQFTADPAWEGRRVFMQFDAVGRVADVFLNGKKIGTHAGAYGRFRMDLTSALVSGENVLAVRANNEANNILPLTADFTLAGGIYRDVSLVVVDPLHVALRDHGSPGVYLTPILVTAGRATLAVRTLLENDAAKPADAVVQVRVHDAAGAVVASSRQPVRVDRTAGCDQQLSVEFPRLWRGRADPYLYSVTVELISGARVIDTVTQPFGFRTVRIDPENGFFLNGERYDLHGVNYHQDMLDRGPAVSAPDRIRDFATMVELGCTSIRFCHYQHGDAAYELCDHKGLLAWAEFNFHFGVPAPADVAACLENAQEQLRELIRQNYNRPSIFCWSIGDETTDEELDRALPMLRELNALAKAEDPTRPTTYASHHADGDPRNFLTDAVGFNPYYGWYYGKPAELGPRLDEFHRRYPRTAVAVSEYGAGASIYQHEQNPPYRNVTQAKGPWHPEEWQDEIHEQSWLALKQRPYLWANYVWLMFDFASDRRNEGDHPGRNDKGLVTYDRAVRKDAYHWYQANWTGQPMVYITSRRDTVRRRCETDVKVYSTCDTVELFINGVSQGTRTAPDRLFFWTARTLSEGANRISVEARTADGTHVTDSCYWTFTPGTPTFPPTDEGVAATGN